MDRWAVYEYMKNRFMRTGEIPRAEELQAEFPGLEAEEMAEGRAEFDLMIGRDRRRVACCS